MSPFTNAEPMGLELTEFGRRDSEASWVAAHFVERHQSVEVVEDGVLESLGHHRSGILLESHDELWLDIAGHFEK